jgi:hypothetical protein
MRKFDYVNIPNELMNYELMNLVSAIHEYKESKSYLSTQSQMCLRQCLKLQRFQSTGASNRIEGIHTSDERLDALIKAKAEPRKQV